MDFHAGIQLQLPRPLEEPARLAFATRRPDGLRHSNLHQRQARLAISGAGGKAATANCRAKLTELLDFIKADVLPNQTGVAVPAEAWGTDILTLTDEQKAELKAQAEALIG